MEQNEGEESVRNQLLQNEANRRLSADYEEMYKKEQDPKPKLYLNPQSKYIEAVCVSRR